jgi:peptidoglycan/xylan/chitin deacetylase (PgdA/CDA1 family)
VPHPVLSPSAASAGFAPRVERPHLALRRRARTALFSAVLALAPVACSSEAGVPADEPSATIDPELVAKTGITGKSLPKKTVIFTYDDGPDEHTLELAQYLADNDIHVVFFINGRRICKTMDALGNCTVPMDTRPCDDGKSQAPVVNPKYYPESLLDEVLRLGHRIANHTEDHCHLQQQTNQADLVFELKTTQDILDRHICDGVYLFRPPYGEWDTATTTRVQMEPSLDKLVGPVLWDVDGEDYACWQTGMTADACGTRYLGILTKRANQNGIFLMHDRPEFNVGYEGPVLLTKWLVPKLKDDGYRFATFDELLSLDAGAPCVPDAGAGGSTIDDAGSAGAGGQDAGAGGTTGSGGAQGSGGGATGGSSSGGSGGGAGSIGGAGGTANSGTGGSGATSTSGAAEAEGSCSCSVPGRTDGPARTRTSIAFSLLGLLALQWRGRTTSRRRS